MNQSLSRNISTKKDERIAQLKSGTRVSWLTDTEIDMFLDLLRHEFPRINGLEDPLMIRYNIGTAIRITDDFVRVLNSGNNHWVTITGSDNL